MRIHPKFVVAFLLIGLVPLVVSGAIAYCVASASLRDRVVGQLESVATIQRDRVASLFAQSREKVALVASRTQLRRSLREYLENGDRADSEQLERILSDARKSIGSFEQIHVVSVAGEVLFSTDPESVGADFSGREVFERTRSVKSAEVFVGDGGWGIDLAGWLELDGEQLGVVVIESNPDDLRDVINSRTGLGETGETLLARLEPNGDALFLSPLLFHANAELNLRIPETATEVPVIAAVRGKEIVFEDGTDYRGESVLAVTRYIPELGWGVVVKLDRGEALAPITRWRYLSLLVVLATLVIVATVSLAVSGSITRPIVRLTQAAERISAGDLEHRVAETSDDEIGSLAAAFQRMADKLIVANLGLERDVEQQTSELVRAQSRLRESEERLRRAVLGAPYPMMMHADDGEILLTSRAWNDESGFSNESVTDLDGWLRRVLVDSAENGDVDVSGLTTEEGALRAGELEIRTRDGERKTWDLSSGALGRLTDGRRLYICVAGDVTTRKAVEHQLQFAKEAAESANRAKSEFLANMSHEIRTPMNAIIGMTQLALDSTLDPTQREYLRIVDSSAESLLRILNDILDFSKIEVGKLDLELVEFRLRELLGDTLKSLAVRAHEAGVELVGRIPVEIPDLLIGDPGRLRQVVVNLVGNAIKFTREGEVVVGVSVATSADDEVSLEFSVADTGVGIPTEKQARIFEAFAQADSSTTRIYQGTGLGLTISAQLVGMMGGEISVESRPGEGSTFRFTARFGLAPTVPEETRPGADFLRDLPVLVVDDNETNRRILEEMLQQWGMRPTLVASGSEAVDALDRAARAGSAFPLVISDAMMPEMDGYELARRIKAREDLASAVILMLSSAGRGSAEVNPEEFGIAAFRTKPIKQSELLDAILNALHRVPFRAPEAGVRRGVIVSADVRAGGPLRVLLAEDNEINQRLVVDLLERSGHRVVVVGTGSGAVEASRDHELDLILMDVQMPDMDGLEATRRIRNLERAEGRHVPIIALTAHVMAGDRERCLKAGMDGYVSKPIRVEALAEIISGLPVSMPAAGGSPEGRAEDHYGRDELLARFGGDEELLHEIVTLFIEDSGRMCTELREAVAIRDCRRVERAAHTLKSTVAMFGAMEVSDDAQEMEQMGNAGQLEGVGPVIGRIDEGVARLLVNLRESVDP